MKSFYVLVFFLSTVHCGRHPIFDTIKPLHELSLSGRKGFPKPVDADPASRIVGGQNVNSPYDIPYIVGIITHFEAGNGWCGGALISVNFVLTAGDCVHDLPSATVFLGVSDMSSIEYIIPVSEIIIHPGYTPSWLDDNLGLLRLGRPAKLTDSIQLIRLPRRSQVGETFYGVTAKVSGWGTADEADEVYPSPFLRYIYSDVIANFVCTISYPLYITGSNICTSTSRGTPCLGDEGGPLTITESDGVETLIGIISYTSSWGCSSIWPAVYSRTTSFLDWIADNSDVVIQN